MHQSSYCTCFLLPQTKGQGEKTKENNGYDRKKPKEILVAENTDHNLGMEQANITTTVIMLLVLSDEHKEHLGFLSDVDPAVVGEFGRIAVEFLKKGSNPKIYEGAARKLSVPAETVQHGVEGLMFILTESSKLMISEVDFQDSVLVLGFSEELNKLLLQLYIENRKEIRQILSEIAPSLPCYHNLEWRLDVQ
ncbi:COMM domain-containing protein 2, partial [Clarias magur]